MTTTIQTVIASLQSLDAAIAAVKGFGFPIDVVIVPAQGADTTSHQFQSLVAASAPSVVLEEAPATVTPVTETVAASVASPVSPDARIASLVGTQVKIEYVGRRNSTGYRTTKTGDRTLTIGAKGSDREREAFGYINVYARSLGKDIHKTVEKAQRYGNDKVIDQLPVFAN